MPVFHITTINIFRNRYVVEANSVEEAYDSILIDKQEELSQSHISEDIIDGKEISKLEFQELLEQVKKESYREKGLDNAHLKEKIIYRADLSEG